MNILITGANGFVGSHLAEHVAREPWQVSVLVSTPAGQQHSAWSGQGAFHVGVLPDLQLSAALCRDQHAIIHLAGLAHVTSAAEDLRRCNLDATVQLATVAKTQGVRKFIFISSSKARFPDHSLYGQLKAEAERQLLALHDTAFQVVILRPGLVYGKGMRGNLASLLRVLARPVLPVFVSSPNRIGMIGVNDLCRAIICAVQHDNTGGRAWELADEQPYTLDAIVEHVRALHGYGKPAVHMPRPMLKLAARLSTLLSPLYKSSFSMSTYSTLFDENYRPDPAFWHKTGSRPDESFYQVLPLLLKE